MTVIRKIEESGSTRWNEFVCRHPKATIVHLYEWLLAIKGSYGLEILHLAAEEDGTIVAVLPVAVMKAPLRRPSGLSLPYSGYAGFLVADGVDRDTLFGDFQKSLSRHGLATTEVRQLAGEGDDGGTDVTMKLALPPSGELLWKQLDAKVRNLIRKAERSGLITRWGLEQLDDFYQIYARNMSRLGTPVHSKAFFSEICQQMRDKVDILSVLKDGRAIASMFVLKFRNQIAGPWASSLRQFDSYSPNMLLYWEALRYGCENGFDEFDFGRSQRDSGTEKFKRQWGARPIAIEYLVMTEEGNRRLDSLALYSSSRARLLSRLWKWIPYRLALRLGPRIRKYLP